MNAITRLDTYIFYYNKRQYLFSFSVEGTIL